MDVDRRASPRESVSLPVELAGGSIAIARNVSAGGVFFTVPAGTPVQSWMHVELDARSAGLKFSAIGQVVRIERGEHEDGVALRLLAPKLTPLR